MILIVQYSYNQTSVPWLSHCNIYITVISYNFQLYTKGIFSIFITPEFFSPVPAIMQNQEKYNAGEVTERQNLTQGQPHPF